MNKGVHQAGIIHIAIWPCGIGHPETLDPMRAIRKKRFEQFPII